MTNKSVSGIPTQMKPPDQFSSFNRKTTATQNSTLGFTVRSIKKQEENKTKPGNTLEEKVICFYKLFTSKYIYLNGRSYRQSVFGVTDPVMKEVLRVTL